MSSCCNPFVEQCATLLTTIARPSRCEGPLPALRNGEAAYRCSAFAHAVGGLGGGAGANLLLDPAAHIGIHILPIFEGAAQHRIAHAAQQAPGDLVDQPGALRIVKPFPAEVPRPIGPAPIRE